jgi:hypothetical protein
MTNRLVLRTVKIVRIVPLCDKMWNRTGNYHVADKPHRGLHIGAN